jgi:hypothetical protein
LSRTKIASGLVLACTVALAGCSGGGGSDGGWFSKPFQPFATPDWAKPASVSRSSELGPSGPVGPDDLVGPDGRCGAPIIQAAPEASADPGAVPAGAAPVDAGPTVLGGIALGMSECQTVQRAGTPGNVVIGSGDNGERSVVLTYVGGPWPGIYRFSEGRLKVIDRAPAPPAPPKAPPKKKKAPAKKSAR